AFSPFIHKLGVPETVLCDVLRPVTKPQDRSSGSCLRELSWCCHGGQNDEGGASKPPCPDAAGAGSHRPASGRRSGPGRAEQRRSLLEISFPPAVHGHLRAVRASLYPARPHEARFIPASLRECPKRHGHSDGCRLRCTGRLRPRLSATVRAIAFVVPEISRLGAVACGLRASRQREEQAHAENFYR